MFKIKGLARKLFTKRSPAEKNLYIVWILQTRAWVIFSSFSLARLAMLVTSTGAWFGKQSICLPEEPYREDCIYNYNVEQLGGPVQDMARWVLASLVILSLLLCILCYKWRVIANSFLYFECAINIIAVFIPNTYNARHSNIDMTMLSVIYVLSLYTDRADQLIMAPIHLGLTLFVKLNLVYLNPLTVGSILMNSGLVLAFFICTCFVGMMAI